MHLGQSQKTKPEYINSKKQEKLDISIRINWTKPAFNMISRMNISRIYQEEQRLRKYCDKALQIANNSKYVRYQSRLRCPTNSWTRRLEILVLMHELELFVINNNWPMNYTSSSLENL